MDSGFQGVFVAERIVKKRQAKNGSGVEYLIKWKGWSPYHNTWEPEGNVLDKGLVDDFEAKQIRLKIKSEIEADRNGTGGKVNEKSKPLPIPYTHYHTRKIESFINGAGTPKTGERMDGSRKTLENSRKPKEIMSGKAFHNHQSSRPKTTSSISDSAYVDSLATTLSKFSNVNQEFVKSQVQNVLAHCLLSQETDQALPTFVRSNW